jgi:hypothetical protein
MDSHEPSDDEGELGPTILALIGRSRFRAAVIYPSYLPVAGWSSSNYPPTAAKH